MLYVVKWIYAWVLPLGSIVLALVGLAVYQHRCRARGAKWLGLVTCILYALATVPVSNMLIMSLEQQYAQPAVESVQGDVLVMLGGGVQSGVPDIDGSGQLSGAAANRFLTVLRLHRALHLPILLSGGSVMPGDACESAVAKRMLVSLGVSEDMIYTDEHSRNTKENAAFSKQICNAHGWKKPVIVTSAFHMPRAVYFFQREGLPAVPYPCDYLAAAGKGITPYSLVPQASVLADSCVAIKEYMGLAAARIGMQ